MSIKLGSQKKTRDKKRKEPITYYELVEQENLRNNPPPPLVRIPRKFPIAPDGFVPNSVVQRFFTMFEQPEEVPAPVIWRLNWKPTDIMEENTSGKNTPAGKVLEYDWTDVEDELSDEEKKADTADELDNDDEDAPERMLSGLVNRMREHEWFEVSNENLNVSYLVRYLFGKLIEREPDNHLDVCTFIQELNEKFKINQDTLDWSIMQLEDELDATDEQIVQNNLGLVASFGVETYRIDLGLLNIIKKAEDNDPKKEEAKKILESITNSDSERIEFALANIKKMHNSKYKKEEADFVLTNFVEDIEAQIAENLEVSKEANDVTKNSEIFKTILKEDWIASNIKESFKSLEDFLEYFIKYLKTAKSKIFYEKVANFLHSLYHEFKLENSDWEIQIIEHFVNNNTDPKVAEALRLIDLENLGKYYPNLKDIKQKHQILIELLRSACFEKTRKQVMKVSNKMLHELTSFTDDFLTSLIDFYSSKKFSTVTILSWSETLDFLKNKPDITTEDILEMKELDPSILVSKVEAPEVIMAKPKRHKKGKKGKKDKNKKEKKEKKAKEKLEDNQQKATDENEKAAVAHVEAQLTQESLVHPDYDQYQNVNKDTIPGDNLVSSQSRRPVVSDGNLDNNTEEEYFKMSNENEEQSEDLVGPHSVCLRKKSFTPMNSRESKKSADIFIPSPSHSVKNKMNDSYYKESYKTGTMDLDTISNIPVPKSSIQQMNSDFLSPNIDLSRSQDTRNIENELCDEYLSGITKRVVFFEKRFKLSAHLTGLKSFTINEKCHLIDQNEINAVTEINFKFESFKNNRRSREEEYNKLLQCLIIRGLDLHRHYERLMPKNLEKMDNSPAQSLQFFNDFLIVHPYNLKNMNNKHRDTYQVNKRNVYDNLQMNMYMTEQERKHFNNDAAVPNRRPYKTHPLGGSRNTASSLGDGKIEDLELNHIFLINKLLISYGAQNLKKFYSSINTDFRSFMHRLHSRIPHRIVPLIWNDPVIQKIAMIISSSKQLQTPQNYTPHNEPPLQQRRYADSPGLNELRSKLNVKTLPTSGTFVRNKDQMSHKFNLVTAYHIEDEPQVDRAMSKQMNSGVNFQVNGGVKDNYEYWPLFKHAETPTNKVAKRKLYSHLVNMKNEYVKLQWRYMLQEDKCRKTRFYLPPLSYKAQLNRQPQHQFAENSAE